ncbi:hypothetical protein [Streptomyces sp. NBC_00035]|uniref:hypothetical protein n=1 Tax=Streptomyces sp. NBC_00035 TaxID=2903614 RepID=UPI00324A91AD
MTTDRPAEETDAAEAPEEDHSTGTAWHRPQVHLRVPGLPANFEPCTPQEQARHRAELSRGIAGYVVGRPAPLEKR